MPGTVLATKHCSEILHSSKGKRSRQFCLCYCCVHCVLPWHRGNMPDSVSMGMGKKDLPEKVKSKLRPEGKLTGTRVVFRHCAGLDAHGIAIY